MPLSAGRDDREYTKFRTTATGPVVAVWVVDINGDLTSYPSNVQYTEDAPSAADPVGTSLNLIRADTPAAVTNTDGDNISARGTNKGELYVKQLDAIPAEVGTTTIAGQTTVAVTNTAVQLASNTCKNGVIVQALAGNAGNVVVGPSGVTTANGFQLQPGQATSVAISNTSALWANGTSGDGVCWITSN